MSSSPASLPAKLHPPCQYCCLQSGKEGCEADANQKSSPVPTRFSSKSKLLVSSALANAAAPSGPISLPRDGSEMGVQPAVASPDISIASARAPEVSSAATAFAPTSPRSCSARVHHCVRDHSMHHTFELDLLVGHVLWHCLQWRRLLSEGTAFMAGLIGLVVQSAKSKTQWGKTKADPMITLAEANHSMAMSSVSVVQVSDVRACTVQSRSYRSEGRR